MASPPRLSILEKQKLLLQKSGDQALLKSWGDRYLEQGCIYEALDFYERAKVTGPLPELRKRAVATGNMFLYRRVMAVLKEPETPQELQELAARCTSQGKVAYARVAAGEPAIPPPAEPATSITMTVTEPHVAH